MWEWSSPAQTVPVSQAMQAQEGKEFLNSEGRHFCRLVGKIAKLISERDMVVPNVGYPFCKGYLNLFSPTPGK